MHWADGGESDVDETTAQVIAAAARKRNRPRMPLAVWAWQLVPVLRVALVVNYLLFIALATMAFIAGVPVFRLTAPAGYAAPWAVLLGIASILAAVGSLDQRWQILERWAALAVGALALGYVVSIYVIAFGSGDLDRQTVALAVTFMLILPTTRFAVLASQAGREHPNREGS